MSPLRWMQSTGPHWRVKLEDVTSDTLTDVGGPEGAISNTSISELHVLVKQCLEFKIIPVSLVIPEVRSLTVLP